MVTVTSQARQHQNPSSTRTVGSSETATTAGQKVVTKRQPNPTLAAKQQATVTKETTARIDVKAAAGKGTKSQPKKNGNVSNRRVTRSGPQQTRINKDVAQITKGVKTMGITSDTEDHIRPEPIHKLTASMKHSSAEVDFELFQNSNGEILFTIRKHELDNTFQRVIVPFSFLPIFIEKLNVGLSELNANKEIGILNQLNDKGVAFFVNMVQKNYKKSNYYIDFKANEDKTDIILQISEKKKIPGFNKNGPRTRNYVLEFHIFDMVSFVNKLTKFHEESQAKIDSNPDLIIHKTYGVGDFTMEWIKPQKEANYLLKVSTNNNRIIFPINTCRALKNTLLTCAEAYEKCGQDAEAYMQFLRNQRDQINSQRQELGQPLLPPITDSIDNAINKRAKTVSESGDEVRINNSRLLFTQKLVSTLNHRTYHFDLVLNVEYGAIRLRIVEQQHSNNRQLQQDSKNSRPKQLRHSIFMPVEKIKDLITTLDQVIQEVPLPKEGSQYYPGGRCFFKYNIRKNGLTFKIKVQSVVTDDENAESHQNDGATNGSEQHHTKYGNTKSLELPMQATQFLINYMNTHTL